MIYLQLFADKEALLEPFDDAERGRLLSAMMAYAFHGEEPELTGNERYIWPVLRQMIDQSRDALQKKQAGGKARAASQSTSLPHEQECNNAHPCANDVEQTAADASTSQQMQADVSTSQQAEAERHINKNQESRIKSQDTRNKREEGDCARTKARFAPPTAADVSAYARDKGLTLDAERFCDFYASKGWKVGSQPMKDWQAAVRNWCARDKQDASSPRGPTGKVLREQQYDQREYEAGSSVPDWMMRRMHEKEAGTA